MAPTTTTGPNVSTHEISLNISLTSPGDAIDAILSLFRHQHHDSAPFGNESNTSKAGSDEKHKLRFVLSVHTGLDTAFSNATEAAKYLGDLPNAMLQLARLLEVQFGHIDALARLSPRAFRLGDWQREIEHNSETSAPNGSGEAVEQHQHYQQHQQQQQLPALPVRDRCLCGWAIGDRARLETRLGALEVQSQLEARITALERHMRRLSIKPAEV